MERKLGMKFFKFLQGLSRIKNHYRKSYSVLISSRNVDCFKDKNTVSMDFTKSQKIVRQVYMENEIKSQDCDDCPLMESEYNDQNEEAKNILFKNSEDIIIHELNNCVSVGEVLNLVKKCKHIYKVEHIMQTIFVLTDLQNIFYRYNSRANSSRKFIDHLCKNQEFKNLLQSIKLNLSNFDPGILSYLLLYLNKLGIPMEEQLMQTISLRLRNQLIDHFSLDNCSRFLNAIFTELSVRPYYMSMNLVPEVLHCIEKCNSVSELGYLTLCLNRLRDFVTLDILERYKDRIKYFLNNSKLKGTDYQTILKIAMFLNYPEWRDQNAALTSNCILLLKNDVNLLNVSELIILYDVFFKNQEPGDILNNFQRCSAKFLQQNEEAQFLDIDSNLKLFSGLIYFCSPLHRLQFRKDMRKFLKQYSNYGTLVLLRKVFSYVKISDKRLCEDYWNISLKLIDKDENVNNVIQLCQNYMNFNIDLDNYRYFKFENRILQLIESKVTSTEVLSPMTLAGFLSFTMIYGKNERFLKLLINRFEENLTQFKAQDCLKLSQSFPLLNDIQDSSISKQDVMKMRTLLNKLTEQLLDLDDSNFGWNSVLLKAAVWRNDYDNLFCDNMLMKYKEMDYMSSKMLENIFYIFISTKTLIPEVINKCTEYIVNNQNNVIGFNVEKILFLCYFLGYYPINADKFFQTATDIVIRDQERLSGLSFLQSALALCFFDRLPSSFIKQIFNVEFMDKLDIELANCYSKDKYPLRVRNSLMQLNRAVCLEYPEFNVPWFHKKFIEDINKKYRQEKETTFIFMIKEYITEVAGGCGNILENVITPYGYQIDFVLSLNEKEEIVSPDMEEIKKRVAFMLIRQYALTRFYTHLKGKYQLKKRHLEMLGYTVAIINYNEWTNLLYGEERLEYISRLIWPQKAESVSYTVER